MLFVAALFVRVAAVLVLESYEGAYTYEHGEIANNLLEGRGFRVTFLGVDGLTSQQAPLYPALLAGVYFLFGSGTDSAHLAMQLLQCIAGAAIVPGVFFLTRSLFARNAALPWVAAIGAAVYPPHIYMVTHLQVVTWATLVLTWLAAECFSRKVAGTAKVIRLGVLSGVLLLIDPILALTLPLLALGYWLRARGATAVRLPILRPALMAAVAVLMVAPWVARNYQVHGDFVFVKSTFGYAFWQGNNAHSWGTDKIPKSLDEQPASNSLADTNRWLAAARSETLYIDGVLLTESDYAAFAQLSEVERCRVLGDRAKAFIAANPEKYLALCLQRLRYFFWIDETNPKANHPLNVLSTALWLALLGCGILTAGFSRAQATQRIAWLSLAIVIAIGIFHAATISSARFRLPIEPISLPWCAVGASAILGWLWNSQRALVEFFSTRRSLTVRGFGRQIP